MYQIRLKKSDDAVLTLDMPEHIEEVDLSPAVMFNVNYEKLHEFNVKIAEAEEEEDEEFEVDRVEELMLMVDCVAAYFDLKPEVFDEVFSGIGDDDFDTDNGFSGSVQFCLAVRDPQLADNPAVSTSEFFESDNNASGTAATPLLVIINVNAIANC